MKKLTEMLRLGSSAHWRARRPLGAGAAEHRLHHHSSALEHLLAGGEEGLRRRLRQDPGQLPDDLHPDRRLDRAAGGQYAGRARRQPGRADHLDRRQQRLRPDHQARRATRASSSSRRMSTIPRAPRATRARPSSARASSRPANARQGDVGELPEGRPDPGPRRRLRPRPELVGAARRRRHQVPRGIQGGESRTARSPSSGSTTGTDRAVVADRVGAYLYAHPDTTVYFDTGFWHAGVARVLADRGVAPGKVLLGGFDLVPEVLQQMKAGYVQVQIDQQPYMQGFMPVMEAYLAKTVGLAPADIDTGQGVVTPDRSTRSWTVDARACARPSRERGRRPSAAGARLPLPAAAAFPRQEKERHRRPSVMKRLLKIYLEKPELAAVCPARPARHRLPVRSNGVFLTREPARHARPPARDGAGRHRRDAADDLRRVRPLRRLGLRADADDDGGADGAGVPVRAGLRRRPRRLRADRLHQRLHHDPVSPSRASSRRSACCSWRAR